MSQQDEPRWATAYHEAGHCVAGLVTGEHPTKSSIVAGDNYEGATWFDEEDVEALLVDDPPNEAAEWYIIRAFAGPIAEHRQVRHPAQLYTSWGWALHLAGQPAAAAATLRRAVSLDPTSARARQHLQRVLGQVR